MVSSNRERKLEEKTRADLSPFYFSFFLDSAEVRGVLLVDDEEWGRVTFDFLQ